MATKTLDPKTVTNINGDTIPYRQLSNRVNLTSGSGYANWGAVYNTTNSDGAHYGCNPKNTLRNYCKAIAGKNGSHRCPSRIDCTNYQAGLPANAKVTGITVSYRYDKGGYSNNSYPNIGAPTIDLLGVNVAAKKGTSPPKDSVQSSAKNFSLSWTGLNLKGSDVNKTAFGVAFKLPCNTNTEPGYIRMSYLRVTITYVAENYIPTIQSISPDRAVYGNKFIATFKIDETNKAVPSDNVSAAITIPSGLSVSRVISVNGSFNTGNNVWTAKTTNYTATLQIELTTTGNSTGSKNLKITVGNNSAQKTLTVLSIDITLSCSITGNTVEIPSNDNIDNPQTLYLHIKVGKNSPVDFYTSINLNINIPLGLKIKDPNIANKIINGVYNVQADGTSNGWINNQHNLTIPLIGVTEGEYDITVSSNSISNSCSFHVIVTMPEPTTGLYYGAFQLPQFSYDQMKDGKTYVFGCYSRYIGNNIVSGAKNLRVVVINGDTVVWSEKITIKNEWEWLEIRFEYNSMFPVEIQLYGDYLDYGTGEPHFSNFLLMDEDQYRGDDHNRYSSPLLYLKPLENLFEDSIEEAMLTFDPPERIQSAEHYLSDFNLEPLQNAENIKIQGLAVSMDINIEDLTGIKVGLGSKDSEEFFFESKSKVPPEINHINFGGEYENWTIPFKDLPDFLNNVELFLQLDADAEKLEYQYDVRVSNVSLVIYYSEDISNGCGFSIDEIHGKYYNIKWLNNKMPEGCKWDINLLKIEGGDGSTATRANIEDKTIELEISFSEDSFSDLQNLKDHVIRYFTPLRDRVNKPIPKKLVFDHQPDRYYEYILQDNLDLESTGNSLKGSIKMIIPDGLANGLELVENESAGNVRSLSKVEPVIDIEIGYNNGNKPFEIKEEYTKQSVKLIGRDLNNPDLNNPLVQGTKVKIDSENLIVQYKDSNTNKWLLLPVEYIDLNSTFFIIQNQFKFVSVNENCRISNVSYYTKH